jgi:acyl-CoA hydrolase
MTFIEADLPARTVASTQSEMTEIILPNDTNTMGNLLGGRLMHFIDLTGALAAYRHIRTNVVTASMDHIDFIEPARVGDLLNLKSSVNRAFKTSVEVGVKVWVEHPQTGEKLHAATAYLVYVSVDRDLRPLPVPQVIPETPDEMRRYADAMLRREHRESEAQRHRVERRASAEAESDLRGYL